LGGPLSKLCATPPFSINFRCKIENQVSDYRLLGASSLMPSLKDDRPLSVALISLLVFQSVCPNLIIITLVVPELYVKLLIAI
jgi:hypothetical protein